MGRYQRGMLLSPFTAAQDFFREENPIQTEFCPNRSVTACPLSPDCFAENVDNVRRSPDYS
jgi:hypothetical protein